jgi:hypothetical protein
VRRELNVLALLKGNERYVYIYDEQSRDLLLESFRGHAASPELSLNWFDAAVLTQKAHEQTSEADEDAVCTEPRPRF